MRRILVMALVLGLVSLQALGDEERGAPRVVIGLDLSESNPLIANPQFALKLAERVADEIEALPLRSEVLLRTFGDNDAAANTIQINEIISARNKPETVAQDVGLLIANMPSLVSEGKIPAQRTTNIIAFLQTMHVAIGECKTPTRFILLSDGLEDSEYARLRLASSHLPPIVIKAPRDKRYKCDDLQILGLGQGLQKYEEIERLRDEWTSWAVGRERPFKSFTGLNDW